MGDYIVDYAAFASTGGIDSFRDKVIIVRVSDASSCQEQEQLSESQQADTTALEPGDTWSAVRMLIHTLNWSLARTRRTVEAFSLPNVIERGLRIAAVVFDMKGQPDGHWTIDLPALRQFIWAIHVDRDKVVDGLWSCCSRRVETSVTMPDYLPKG